MSAVGDARKRQAERDVGRDLAAVYGYELGHEDGMAEGAKAVLDALADRLDFWDGRPWEGEVSTNDILDHCERAAALAKQAVRDA